MIRRRTFVAMAAAAGTTLVAPGRGFAQPEATTATPMADTTPRTGYAPVNGLQMYYEIHGSGGVPLVMLHGSFGTIELWGPLLETLAQTRQVIAIEQQGHGHTADIDRPLRYEHMADDTAACCGTLVSSKPTSSDTAWAATPLCNSLSVIRIWCAS